MRKLVIVDDEIRQCRGLQTLLKRQYAELDVQIFTSAPEALAGIEKERPEIVITDICMPEMNGLEMTEAIKKMDSRIIVILLTGYAEFEYARKAISVGAFEYLIKPLNPERLKEVLEKAEEELKKAEILSAQHEKMQEQLDMALPVYMENILNQWVYGWSTAQEKSEVEKVIPEGKDGFLVVTHLPGLNDRKANLDKKDAEELRSQLIWWMRGMIRHPWHCLSFFSNVVKDTMVTIVISLKDAESGRKETKDAYRQIKQTLEARSYPSFLQKKIALEEYRMVIGELQYDVWNNIEKIYQNTVDVLPYFFYFPEKNILHAETVLDHQAGQSRIGITEEEELREAVKRGESEQAKEIFGIIWDRCCSGGYPDPLQLKSSFRDVLEHVAYSLHSEIVFADEENSSWKDFCRQAEEYLERLAEERAGGIRAKSADIIGHLDVYLEEHFCEEITLDDLAAYFGVASAYCSKLIKDVTDDNFSKLLVKKRIKKAKEFLEETELRIYEIAERTGYNDVKYFNRVFKKETGVTPVQYRKTLKKSGGGIKMSKIKEYYRNLSLRNKLRFSYILLIIIPVTLLCVGYYWAASQNILDVAKKNILDVTKKNIQIMDQQLSTIENRAVQLNVDAEIFEILQGVEDAVDSEILIADRKMKTILQNYFSGDDIVAANIMTPRYVFGDNSQFVIPKENFFESEIYKKAKGKKGIVQWMPTYRAEEEYALDFAVENKIVFSLVQELNPVLINPERPNSIEYLKNDMEAVLVINFKETQMEKIFGGSNSIKDAFYCVSSQDGVIVSHSDKEKNGSVESLPWLKNAARAKEGSVVLDYQGRKMVVCYVVSDATGWVAASVTPVGSLLNTVSKLQLLTVIIWILLFILAMILANIFSRRIVRPVNQLVEAMKQTGTGDFGIRLSVQGKDEMQYLTEKYNEMGEKIQLLIEQNYKSEIRKKEAEIMALNLQLNPHFLYNTLNIINMMALEEGNDEVSKMLISLSDMLQYTFRNRQELVEFNEEYLWLQNYLHIMKTRFEGKFEVCYKIDKNVYQYSIPKLLLQPLVENAIIHGFRGMNSGGILQVTAEQRGQELYLEVADNGRGMDEEELKDARSKDYNRIGLNNAEMRIRLIYGEKGKLQVITAKGEGTRIIVTIPCEIK